MKTESILGKRSLECIDESEIILPIEVSDCSFKIICKNDMFMDEISTKHVKIIEDTLHELDEAIEKKENVDQLSDKLFDQVHELFENGNYFFEKIDDERKHYHKLSTLLAINELITTFESSHDENDESRMILYKSQFEDARTLLREKINVMFFKFFQDVFSRNVLEDHDTTMYSQFKNIKNYKFKKMIKDDESVHSDSTAYSDNDVYRYLFNLQKSGVTNMMGATPYIEKEFPGIENARELHINWMKNYQSIKDCLMKKTK